MSNWADTVIRLRWPIIIGFILVTIFFGFQIRQAEIDTDMKSQLPLNMQSRLDTDKIDEIFGGTEMLMVLIRTDDVLNSGTLERVKKISRQVNRLDGVDKVMSLFDLKSIRGELDAMIVEPAVKRIPNDDSEREVLRQEIRSNDIVYGSVVSRDFTLTAVIAMLKTDTTDEEIVRAMQAVIQKNLGEEEIILGGLPYSRLQMSDMIKKDLGRLMPVGIMIMLIFLYACFRRLSGIILPSLVVIMSILFAMGFIPLFGWKIHIITIILPILLVAIANDYGIHMIAKYQEFNQPGVPFSKKEMAAKIFRSLSLPVLFTGLTTVAGMLCLLSHILIPAKQLGVLAAAGILFALVASLFFLTAVISFMPRSKPIMLYMADEKGAKPFLDKMLAFFGRFVVRHPRGIILASVLIAVVCSIGIFDIVVDTNPTGYFKEDHPVVQASNLIDSHLGGSQNISVVYQGDIRDPELLEKIDKMERTLESMDEVGNTASVARVVRQMSRALNAPGDSLYDRIPKTRQAVAQYFELYSMSGDPEDFEKLVDFNYKHALVTARINKTSTITLNQVVERIEGMVEGDQDVMLVGGFGVVLSDLAYGVVNGQVQSLLLASVIVAAMLMCLFRSWAAGLISAVPLCLSILVLFGLMGLLNIDLNIATAMLSSIMIGVGVDYTIHFLWRYREERRNGHSYDEAVRITLTTTGRGIIFNAFSVIVGFVVLLISNFIPVRFFGFLVVVSIFSCLVGGLVLVPAVCLVLKPRFLESKNEVRQS